MKKPRWSAIKNPAGYAKRMNKKERIDFILNHGSEQQKSMMKSILRYPYRDNSYTIDKKIVWKQTDKGRRVVQTIVEKKIGTHQIEGQS